MAVHEGEMPEPALTLLLFGPFEARVHGAPLPPLRSRKGQWLLALLALRHGREVERSWLGGQLWPASTESQALANLRNSLTDLRDALGPEAGRLLSPTSHTLRLELAEAEADVIAFDAALARGDAASLEQAVALYRGPLLEGCAEEWVFEERLAREQAYLEALERLAALARERSDGGAAERFLRRAVALDPSRETAQRALMEALAAAGSYAAAIQVYRELRLHLHEALNAEPDAETRALFERIRAEARRRADDSSSKFKVQGSRSGDAATLNVEPSNLEPARSAHLPVTGETVTFLFTDIEGSTRLWEQYPEAMSRALTRHNEILSSAVSAHGGHVFKTVGDEFCAAFATAPDALAAALAGQRGLHAEAWEELCAAGEPPLRVRMALHTGTAEAHDGDFFGPALNRVGRLLTAAHGGQVILSAATQQLAQDSLPPGASLRDLGTHRLRDLQRPEHIFQLLHPDLPADFPPLRSLDAMPHNLPQQVTSFIGREKEMQEVKRLLGSTRLLTVTGSGGTGKTRLTLQVAAELLQEYPDGVWLVELAPLADPALVLPSVAAVFGLREQPGKPLAQTLIDHLKPRKPLLILDNCEHLLAECARLAELLLRSCPGVQILASSREGLNIPGELTYRVPSLAVPDPREWLMVDGSWLMSDSSKGRHQPSTINHQPSTLLQYESVRLFIDRAVAHQPAFRVTDRNATAVAQICHRLDGIPLAIELAAARVKVLTVEKVAERLDDRFRLLTGGSRTALPRQQTLRALIDWSYDLLSHEERTLLRRLAVFAGGWTLDAAEAVCADPVGRRQSAVGSEGPVGSRQEAVGRGMPGGSQQEAVDRERLDESGEIHAAAYGMTPSDLPPADCLLPTDVLDLLSRLVDKSLVQYEEGDGEARYRLLETIRQYARERLQDPDEARAVRDRHLHFFFRLAQAAEPELTGPDQRRWRERLDREHDNMRAALEWSLQADPETGLRLAATLGCFWELRGYFTEGRERLGQALARGRDASPVWRARALSDAARLAWYQGDFAAQRAWLEESLGIYRETGDRRGLATALHRLGLTILLQGEIERARALADESVAILRELDAPADLVEALLTLGIVALWQHDFPAARAANRESLAICQQAGDRRGLAASLLNLGQMLSYDGDTAGARPLLEESLAIFRELGDRWGTARSLYGLGHIARDEGDFAAARAFYGQAVQLGRDLGLEWGLLHVLQGLVHLVVREEQWERAARLFGALKARTEALRVSLPRYLAPAFDRDVAAARAALGEAAFATAWAAGQVMTLHQALDLALQAPGGV